MPSSLRTMPATPAGRFIRKASVALIALFTGGASGTPGQTKQSANPSNSQATSAAGGITYLRGDLVTDLTADGAVVLCYELKPTGSPTQPYTLSPSIIEPKSNCFHFADRFETPLASKNKLVVKIHGRTADFDQFKTFTINVTTQPGTAINPTPLRPMMSTASATSAAPGGEEERPSDETNYLIWPFKLQGDTVPTVAISGVYSPGICWKPKTVFSSGALIVASPDNHHFYTAVQGGHTGENAPTFLVATNGKVLDGTVIWQESGLIGITNLPGWQPNTPYALGDTIFGKPDNGHAYVVVKAGQSDANPPTFSMVSGVRIVDASVIWQEAGTGTSQSASASPTDQNISLLSLGLPQVHALSYYNVSFGVVVSSLRNPNFLRTQITPSPNPTYQTTKDNGPLTVAPILAFTTYILPLDAERDWRPRDLWPGFTVGFSLTDPANSFFFGGSSEIRRNVQLTYGLNLGKINALGPGIQDPTSNAAPPTTKKFAKGGFVGLTVNFDFIKTLFSGGGSKS